uniref:Uncharacterized protein n=1 Tax=Seriola dumerili TaxID=41447 RepID=A0A3B4U4I5_SERDU
MSPSGHILGSDGLLDAIHLLLVALAVAGGVLLRLLQSRFQGLDPLSRSTKAHRSAPSPFLQRLSSFSNQVMVFLKVLFFSFSLSYFCFHCSAVSSILTVTVFLIVFALDAEKTLSYCTERTLLSKCYATLFLKKTAPECTNRFEQSLDQL